MSERAVVFVDLSGSTAFFESQGNQKASHTVSRLTQWMGEVCDSYHGHVVRYLGDGALMLFPHGAEAVDAVTTMQRMHQQNLATWPTAVNLRLKVGVAYGDVVEQPDGCFGDAVNVASRLCDLAAPDQILATEALLDSLGGAGGYRALGLGPMPIRGRSELCVVFRIEWRDEEEEPAMDMTQASLRSMPPSQRARADLQRIALVASGASASFTALQVPILLGRDTSDAHFVVAQPSVSRLHARIEWRQGLFVLEDASSFGTWVRFNSSGHTLALRRQQCVLHEEGELALGMPFEDAKAPLVRFTFPD